MLFSDSVKLNILGTVYVWTHRMPVNLWLAYVTQHIFKVHAGIVHQTFRFNNIPQYTHTMFIHSSINGYLGWFHILADENTAAVNIGVQISLSDLLSILLGMYPEVELLGHIQKPQKCI